MSFTRARIYQYIGLFIAFGLLAAGYWYFSVHAGGRLNSPQTGQLTSGLVGYWSFDGEDTTATVATDRGSGGNNGTMTNTPVKTKGKVGQALDFYANGSDTNAYVTMGDPVSGNLDFDTGDFSVSFFFKGTGYVDQGSSVNVVLAKRSFSGTGQGFGFTYGSANTVIFWVNNTVPTTFTVSEIAASANDNQWHHFVGIRTGGNLYLYKDGALQGSTAITGSISNSNSFVVGDDSDATGARTAHGVIDEVRIYNRALAAGEVQSLYAFGGGSKIDSNVSQVSSRLVVGLTGYWKLDDGSGTSATDSSVNGYTGTLTNGPTWTTGQINGAVSFDGSNDYITMGNNLDLGTSDVTMAAWINAANANQCGNIMGKRQASGGFPQYDMVAGYVNSTGLCQSTKKIGCFFYDGVSLDATHSQVYRTTDDILDGNWHHVVCRRTSGQGLTIFVDGVQRAVTAEQANTTNVNITSTGSFSLGANSDGTTPFLGSIDEARVYFRSLSGDEIAQLARLTAPTGVDTGLKGYWSFNGQDIAGTTAYDRSGAAHTGTLTNGPVIGTGQVGQAVSFDGSNDYVSTSRVLTAVPYTISLWINPSRFGANNSLNGLFYQGNGNFSSADIGTRFNIGSCTGCTVSSGNTNTLFFGNEGDTTYLTAANNALSLNQWQYVSVVVDGSGNQTLYINGTQASTRSGGSTTAPSNNSSYLGFWYDHTLPAQYFQGKLDEVRVYNRALAASEIQALYRQGVGNKVNSGAAIPSGDSTLVGYWSFNGPDIAGTTAYDRSSSGINGTLTNGPTVTPGKLGQALKFASASSQYVSIGDSDTYTLASGFTLSAWTRISSAAVSNPIIAKYDGDISRFEYDFTNLSNGNLYCIVYDQVASAYIGRLVATQSLNTWHHLACTYSGGTTSASVKIYIDGVQSDTTDFASGAFTTMRNTTAPLWIGSDEPSASQVYMNGSLDEARIYNTALSAAQVSALYNQTR